MSAFFCRGSEMGFCRVCHHQAHSHSGNRTSRDSIVSIFEKGIFACPRGVVAYEKDASGRQLHDLKFGRDYVLALGIQWIDGEMKGIWPNKFVEAPGSAPLTYPGIVDLEIPPAILSKYGEK